MIVIDLKAQLEEMSSSAFYVPRRSWCTVVVLKKTSINKINKIQREKKKLPIIKPCVRHLRPLCSSPVFLSLDTLKHVKVVLSDVPMLPMRQSDWFW
jgi:hypothetical protein